MSALSKHCYGGGDTLSGSGEVDSEIKRRIKEMTETLKKRHGRYPTPEEILNEALEAGSGLLSDEVSEVQDD